MGTINAVIPNSSKRLPERYAPILPPQLLILVGWGIATEGDGSPLENESRQHRVKIAKPIIMMPIISLHRYGRFFEEDLDELARTAI